MTLPEFIKLLQNRAEFMPEDTLVFFKSIDGSFTKPTDSTVSSTGATNGKRDIPRLSIVIEDATEDIRLIRGW